MTQIGYWRNTQPTNQRVVVGGYGQFNNVWYILPQGGGGTLGNSKNNVFANFTDLKPNLRSRDLVILGGVLREQAVAPLDVYDVTIVGAANAPRQATSGGLPTGGGACWLAPSSGAVASTPLLELKAQGWTLENIEFTPHTSSGGVRLTRSASIDTIDAGHATFSNCYFAANGGSGQIGIEENGGCRSVTVDGCRFEGLSSGILSLNTAAAVPLAWLIQLSQFMQNTNDIKMSLSYARILKNQFMTAGSGATNKVISDTFISTQGGNNHILLNQFSNTEAEIAPGNGYTGAASDTWMNYVNNQAALAFGLPA